MIEKSASDALGSSVFGIVLFLIIASICIWLLLNSKDDTNEVIPTPKEGAGWNCDPHFTKRSDE